MFAPSGNVFSLLRRHYLLMPGKIVANEGRLGVLIVEDELTSHRKIVAALESELTDVRSAYTAEQALEMIRVESPQIIFTDINLPGISGIELMTRLRVEAPSALFVVITGEDQEQLIIKCLKAGASDFITKPTSVEDLRLVLTRLLQHIEQREKKQLRVTLIEYARIELRLFSTNEAILPAVESIISLLRGFLDHRELERVEMGLNELIRNAYEHGSLGLSYEEKGVQSERGTLEATLCSRERAAQTAGRSISVTASISGGVFSCRVEDQGSGFGWDKDIETQLSPLDRLTAANGRGLLLVRRVFDTLQFNELGNCVTVTKLL